MLVFWLGVEGTLYQCTINSRKEYTLECVWYPRRQVSFDYCLAGICAVVVLSVLESILLQSSGCFMCVFRQCLKCAVFWMYVDAGNLNTRTRLTSRTRLRMQVQFLAKEIYFHTAMKINQCGILQARQ